MTEHSGPTWQPDHPSLADWGVSEDEARELLRSQMCPACGSGPWLSPLTHVAKAHGIDRFTMRDVCGLTTTESVAEANFSQRRAELGREHGQDMREVAGHPRRKYRQTKAGRLSLTTNLEGVTAEQSRESLAKARSPEAQAKRAATLRAQWAALPQEERDARVAKLSRDSETLSAESIASWDRRGRKPCGTRASYRRGCRCDECRQAHLAYRRAHG